MLSLGTKGNGAGAANTHAAGNGNAVNDAIVVEDALAVKRDRRNMIKRIRRALRKDGMDLHHHRGEYYLVPIRHYQAIDVEQFARKVGASRPIGVCVCRRLAWRRFEGVDLCDRCAEVVSGLEAARGE